MKQERTIRLAALILNWVDDKNASGRMHIDADHSTRSQIRFRTDELDGIFPDAPEAASGWGTRNHYFYEIVNEQGKRIRMQLALSGHNLPDDLRELFDWIHERHPSRNRKDQWRWRYPFISTEFSVPKDMPDKEVVEILEKEYDELLQFQEELVREVKAHQEEKRAGEA